MFFGNKNTYFLYVKLYPHRCFTASTTIFLTTNRNENIPDNMLCTLYMWLVHRMEEGLEKPKKGLLDTVLSSKSPLTA
jgi:hypothetical protein